MKRDKDRDTRLIHAGRPGDAPRRIVNPPVNRASTVLFSSLAELRQASRDPYDGLYYGRFGTETQFALQDAFSDLAGAAGTVTTGSGLSAIAVVLSMLAARGRHLLVADNVYAPTRKLCDGLLADSGLQTEYFDARDVDALAGKLRADTAGIFIESPGSLTFELTDVPAVAGVAAGQGIPLVLDNTWATPLYFREFDHGVNISITAATKYIVGHADAMLGLVACDAQWLAPVRHAATALGQYASPDDAWLGLRGLRTLSVRMARHQQQARLLCDWLAQQPEVSDILWPAWPEHPDHALWQRDFSGAGGLFSVVMQPVSEAALAAMLDGLELFGMGYSWGGFESLILPSEPAAVRSATTWDAESTVLRIHAGLESSDDLLADLDAGFKRLRAAN